MWPAPSGCSAWCAGSGPASWCSSGSVMAEGVAPLAAPDTAAEVDEALTDEARNGLERTVAALGRPVERRLVHGDPAAEICRVAAEEGFDLIVVGSHGFGFVKRVL